jgi:hypothetical protein
MFKNLLVSIVLMPVLFGIYAATTRRTGPGLVRLLALCFAYSVFYILLMYYLRYRWLG